jgi:hypothetical protein
MAARWREALRPFASRAQLGDELEARVSGSALEEIRAKIAPRKLDESQTTVKQS